MTGIEPLIIGGAVSLISSLLQSGNNADAQKEIERITREYGPEARALVEKELGGPSAYEGVTGEKLAPEAVAAQREALRRMQQAAAGGYTPEEEAALRNIQSQTAAQAASQQASLLEQFQRRGNVGSGAQLAMAQQAGQSAANRAGMQGLETAANAQRRAFQAMQGLGSQAGNLRSQTVAERQAIGAAEEARKLNRARMLRDINNTMLNAQIGNERTGAQVANQPYRDTADYTTAATKAYVAWDADQKKAAAEAAKKAGG